MTGVLGAVVLLQIGIFRSLAIRQGACPLLEFLGANGRISGAANSFPHLF